MKKRSNKKEIKYQMKEITIIYQSSGFQNLNMQFILEDGVKLDLTNSAKITTTFMILFVS